MGRVTWRTWVILAALAGIYTGCGYWLSGNGTVEAWLYRIGLTAATFVPLLFTGLYTAFGLAGGAKWWRNVIGTALVQAALTVVPIAAPLAWTFWVDNGELTSSWLAWVEVSGPVVSALAWLRLCVIWVHVRNSRLRNGNGKEDV